MSERGKKVIGKSRTKQSFAKQCDINNILGKAARTGTISHLSRYQPVYGDFSNWDYNEALNKVAEAKSMFQELPAEVRDEFQNDPGRFLDFVNTPANQGKLAELLPALADPGRQLPVSGARVPEGAVSRAKPEKVEPEAHVAAKAAEKSPEGA